MPPARRSSAPAAAQPGVFARLKAQAEKDLPEVPPYVIDDVEPPIVIQAPTSTEQQIEIHQLFGNDGTFHVRDAELVLRALCGEAFPRVWEQFRREHVKVLIALIADMGDHFGELLQGNGEGDFPGGSPASSS